MDGSGLRLLLWDCMKFKMEKSTNFTNKFKKLLKLNLKYHILRQERQNGLILIKMVVMSIWWWLWWWWRRRRRRRRQGPRKIFWANEICTPHLQLFILKAKTKIWGHSWQISRIESLNYRKCERYFTKFCKFYIINLLILFILTETHYSHALS